MCGLLGWKHWDQNMIPALAEKNSKRGGYSTGILTLPSSFYNPTCKIESDLGTKIPYHNDADYALMHWRAPTTGGSTFKPEENYPLKYEGYFLMGNGVINEGYFKKIKDEDNNNDLYYILKNVVMKGITSVLPEVEGTYSLVFVTEDYKVYLIRNTFPLFVSDNIFSSVPFEESQELENGVLYQWLPEFKRVKKFDNLYSPYLLDDL